MHELSIADSVVAVVAAHAGGRRVHRVELRVGHLRQVVPSALQFAFGLVAQGTCAEGAELVIEDVPAVGRCRGCDAYSELRAFPLACERCGSWDVQVTEGEELLVDALELEETLVTTGGNNDGH